MAVRRYVFLKLADEWSDPERRAEVAAESRKVLPTVPGVREVQTGLPADAHAEAAWDVVLVVGFDRIDDVQPYVVHPVHRRFVEEYLNPRTAVKKAWNFELP